MQTHQTTRTGSSFTHLLMRYMDGQIAAQTWDRMMQTFDEGRMSTFERMAYARFMNDVIADEKAPPVSVPGPDELEDLLLDIRS